MYWLRRTAWLNLKWSHHRFCQQCSVDLLNRALSAWMCGSTSEGSINYQKARSDCGPTAQLNKTHWVEPFCGPVNMIRYLKGDAWSARITTVLFDHHHILHSHQLYLSMAAWCSMRVCLVHMCVQALGMCVKFTCVWSPFKPWVGLSSSHVCDQHWSPE